MKTGLIELPIATYDGIFLAHYSDKGLAGLDFPNRDGLVAPQNKRGPIPVQTRKWHRMTSTALKQILKGVKPGKFPPLDWTGTTEFQKSVWQAMLKIPIGKTKSYGEIAALIGRPRAVRAVGSACGANRMPVLVPCHRILAAHKKLAASAADWIGNVACLPGRELNFHPERYADLPAWLTAACCLIDIFFVRRILSDMSATVLPIREFTKKFTAHKGHTVQVSDRGRLIGTWVPARRKPEAVDFAARAAADSRGKLPFTFAQLLKEHKKR